MLVDLFALYNNLEKKSFFIMCKEADVPPPAAKPELKPAAIEAPEPDSDKQSEKETRASYSTSSTSSDYSEFSKSTEMSISNAKQNEPAEKAALQRTLPPVAWKDPSSPFLFPDPAICSKSVRGDDLQQLSSSDEFSENSSQKNVLYPDNADSSCDAKYDRILLSM